MKIEELSDIVAKRLKLHSNLVNEINRIQWKFLHKEIQSGEFNPVQIFYIGKFNHKLTKKGIPLHVILNKKKNESSKGDI